MKKDIYNKLYQFKGDERVLDVGCGHPSTFIENEQGYYPDISYTGIDLLRGTDWYTFEPKDYDVIIANDLFPNVDQRLGMFIEKYGLHCKEMRLSLTYFTTPKWYTAKRTDGDEILTMQSFTFWQIKDIIDRYQVIREEQYQGEFANGRKVWLVWLKGGLP